ncbi:PREDICTED: uncharacterized protein LOC109588937 [Amphimedon queenslandica]|uniref:Uncharacterized protein n=1 Tax=Amphimedon queenslandica TaxID=400682 RepID=A0AAN0JTZ2_AMPQE|nr:PREDICTED: uncharacterized protein LOC109588937 [Amphimedon queenslandica]|eukprot:XP_019860596.1 PREDICTED: uncharacterized protein LOC109588937 [Amphimedon queenslandica]
MADKNQINSVQEPEEGHDNERTELVFPLERLHIRTSQLLNNADQRMTEILRKMTDERFKKMNAEQEKLKETMLQIQKELREAKENVKEITELKKRVDDHDKRLRVVEKRDHHGMLQVPVGRRNPSVDSDVGYESRDNSSSSLRRVLEEDVNEEKTLLGPED